MACQGVLIAQSRAFDFDVDFARVGRTLPSASSELALSLPKGQALSVAFDLDLVLDSDFDLDREGHGLQPCRKRLTQINPASAAEGPHPA
jgi:hypothetical protein